MHLLLRYTNKSRKAQGTEYNQSAMPHALYQSMIHWNDSNVAALALLAKDGHMRHNSCPHLNRLVLLTQNHLCRCATPHNHTRP